MSGSENPGFDIENGSGGSNRNGKKKRNVLLLSLLALSLLSLLVLLGNPGLLIPPKVDDNKDAEAVGDSNDSGNVDDSNSDVHDQIEIPETVPDSTGSSVDNNSNNDDLSDSPENGTTDTTNDGNSNSDTGSGSSNSGDENSETDPGTGSGSGSGGGSGGNGGSSHIPKASDGNVMTMEDTPVDIKLNATDFDGNSLTYVIVTEPLNGSLEDFDEATGQLTYVPNTGYTGLDNFSFMAEDFRFESDAAVIGITVVPNAENGENAPPVASDFEVETDEDTSVLIDLPSNVIDANGDELTVSIITMPENGDAVLNEDGTVTYTPDPNYFGEDSFTFQASDSMETSNVATVSITVNSAITIHMDGLTKSYGSSLYSGRQIYAEYVGDTSSLVGKDIDMIVLDLFKFGSPEGVAEIGVFNEDQSVKRLIGTIDVSTLASSPTEYTFQLSDEDDLYMIEAGDRIGIKFDGGSETDNVQVKIDNDPADPFDGQNSYRTFYSDQWEDRPDGDLWMILINT